MAREGESMRRSQHQRYTEQNNISVTLLSYNIEGNYYLLGLKNPPQILFIMHGLSSRKVILSPPTPLSPQLLFNETINRLEIKSCLSIYGNFMSVGYFTM